MIHAGKEARETLLNVTREASFNFSAAVHTSAALKVITIL